MTQKKSGGPGADWKALLEEDADFLRLVIRQVMQEVLEAEMTDALGAAPGERTDAVVVLGGVEGWSSARYPLT